MSNKYRDTIHGFIEVSDLENKIIDSKPFQRLRNIKQLALTHLVYHGAEHTRFGHSLGVMHLVTRAFNSSVNSSNEEIPEEKKKWCVQVLRLIALTHDLGHAPFSHASESVFPDGYEHEDFTEKIIKETEIGELIKRIGKTFANEYGAEYDITPDLLCDIYKGRNSGPNYEYALLRSFMDSELDCDKMDYLLRDSYYCGVKYGTYDVERLLTSLIILNVENRPRLAIKSGDVQSFEEFILARYFMFIQVYFHRTRRFFDIMLEKALKEILPGGVYPSDIEKYLEWDDCRVIQFLKNSKSDYCKYIIDRIVYPCVFATKVHPQEADKREFNRNVRDLKERIGRDNIITDCSAGKLPHKIPKKVEYNDEKSIIIYDTKTNRKTTISEESEIIKSLTEKIDIMRIYCHPRKKEDAYKFIKGVNEVQTGEI